MIDSRRTFWNVEADSLSGGGGGGAGSGDNFDKYN